MYAKPAGVPYDKASQFDHLSLNLPDEEALLRLRDRLKSHDCEVTDVVDHGFIRSIYFSDPNGMALEASWWTLDATGRPADYTDARLFADADPVPAVVELRDSGALDHTVTHRARRRDHRGHLPHERLSSARYARSRSCCSTLPLATPTVHGCARTGPN